jgi:hypothetical protein
MLFCVPPTAVWTITLVLSHSFLASSPICSASSRVGETIMARISEACVRLPLVRCARSGSACRMRWRIGRRKAIVLPVPVFA